MKTFGDVIDAFEVSGIDPRAAYWGGRDGYLKIVIMVNGKPFEVMKIEKQDDTIVVFVSDQ